ncbi:hypothetical protein [Arenimonas sp. GDDSR-1]|uniref:hypothetical protein n=1 Tax=Arenimonas sp. GDDSR-1 TaxID=2950125 RepID=UPI002633B5C5|nr:hypothetical protein [Arenimonas sp. GDDSR-1]
MPASNGLRLVGRLVICALAGLLVFYHTYTLYDLYLGTGTDIYDVGNAATYDLYRHIQSILRVCIITSLVLVVLNKRPALYGMWIAITTLIATHYWAYFFDLPFRFLEGTHPLSYLKGLIIPTVITTLFLVINSRRASGTRAD